MKSRGKTAAKKAYFSTVLPSKRTARYKAGEIIFSQGDSCSDVHYIEEGLVKLPLVSKRGKGAVLAILGHGDFFGEGCISDTTIHVTSAIALVPSTIILLKRRTMVRLIEEEQSISSHFINYLLARNSRMEQDLIDHLVNSSEKRLARTLLLLARYDKESENPSILERISQDTLAEMVGTTRSRVNFFMNGFRKHGLIHYNGGLQVHDSLQSILHD